MLEKINARLAELLNFCEEGLLREAMAYSLLAGGKRLRPMLLLGACEAASGGSDASALDFACALEMIHTYSLIHDDLPAMDDDDFRRGMPSSHKKFGEAMAILAGDALLNRAYETMARTGKAEAMVIIAAAAGDNGMIAGQVSDIFSENKKLDGEALFNIHSKKCGALFSASLEAGAVLGGAAPDYAQAMRLVGAKIGWAFQILDDLLDLSSSPEALGKPTHSDSRNKKNTYVSVHGLSAASADYARISASALLELEAIPQKTGTLLELVRLLIDRKH